MQQCFASCWKLDPRVNLKGQGIPEAVTQEGGQEDNQAIVLEAAAMEDILIIMDKETAILTINCLSSEDTKVLATKSPK